jgi:hypothetical protein
MLDGIVFATVFVAFFILRGIAATVFFYYMLPDTDRCPCCDTPTLRVRSPAWNLVVPWFRTSWCYECGWKGFLRPRAPANDSSPALRRADARARRPPRRDAGVNGPG